MLVLGIDPGTIKMGYGVVDAGPPLRAEDYGVVGLPRTMEVEHRLYQMYTHIQNLIHVFNPAVVAVEEPFVGRGEHQYVKAAMAIGQAQGLVLIGAASQGIPVLRYAPTQVKQSIVDYGGASKSQVQETVCTLLNLHNKPDSDAADALAIAICHLSQNHSTDILSREIIPGQER